MGNLVGISIEEAYPLFAWRLDPGKAFEQVCQAVAQAQVLAIAGGVLSDQVDFTDTLLEEAGGLRDYRFESPAAKGAAILRDDAKRTRMIATLGDLDVRIVARSREHARRQIVVEIRLER